MSPFRCSLVILVTCGIPASLLEMRLIPRAPSRHWTSKLFSSTGNDGGGKQRASVGKSGAVPPEVSRWMASAPAGGHPPPATATGGPFLVENVVWDFIHVQLSRSGRHHK